MLSEESALIRKGRQNEFAHQAVFDSCSLILCLWVSLTIYVAGSLFSQAGIKWLY